MTERRAHWDDDILTAVMAALPERAQREVRADDVYNILAAVEDWARWEHVPKGTLARLERAEAAIARVRSVCDMDAGQLWTDGKVGSRIVAVPQILQALEGDSDELASP